MSALNPDTIPVPMRLRPDLRWSPYSNDRPELWVAHDPIDCEFYFFSSLEKAIAFCLDGNHSVNAILQKARRVDDSVSAGFVRDLIQRLDGASLLLHRSWRHSRKPEVRSLIALLTRVQSVLAFRIPLFNPSTVVSSLEPVGRALFGGWMLWFLPVMVSLCLILLAHRWPELSVDLSTLQSGLRGDRVLLAAILLVLIKGMHEFGHALACRTVGANCREIGLLFFLGIPCLYCDVSDTWRVPDRWKRIVVSAAGMIVELWIAIAACMVWVFCSTPWVQDVALQVMLLCSMVTLLINANPLLRYDGYYILSDGLGIPNLTEQSREAWQQLWRNCLFGSRQQKATIRTGSFAVFHFASSLYRYFLVAALIWGGLHWLLQRRLGNFGAILTAVVALAFLANAWQGLRRIVGNRQGVRSIAWFRVGVLGGVFSLAIFVLGTWRFPRYLFTRAVIESREMIPLYARHSAIVHEVLKQGTAVEDGTTLVAMESPELEMELLHSQGELDIARVRLQQVANRSVDDPLSTQQIGELEETVRATEDRVLKLEFELKQLHVRSPGKGRFIEPVTEQTKTDYAGRNIGRNLPLGAIARDRPFVERGQQVGEVVRESGWRLRAFISEMEIEECKLGAMVFVRLDQWPGVTIQGNVASVSAESLQRTPASLVGDSLFGSTNAGTQSDRMPEQISYSILIDVEIENRTPVTNGLASVQIQANSMTMLERWSMMLRNGWRTLTQAELAQ